MNDSPDSSKYSDATTYDDEISISELIQKLWRKRGLIVFLPLVCAGLTIAGLLAAKTVGNEQLSFYVELNGIKDAKYPNDTEFSPQDLLNPNVLNELADAFKTEENLADHVRVQFGTPVSSGILLEYQSALAANSKAPPEEIARINEQYGSRLSAAAKRGLSINVDYTALGLSKAQGKELLHRLPETWNRVFASEFNIFLDTGILSLPRQSGAISLQTTLGAAEADQALAIIKTGLETIMDDARFRSLSYNGKTPGGALADVDLFRNLYFDPIFTASFAEVGGLSSVYRRDLRLQLDELDAQMAELNSRISVIQELQQRSSNTQAASNGNSSIRGQIQLEGDALGQVVNLSRAASLAEYLQETLDERLKLVSAKAAIVTRLAKMEIESGSSSTGNQGLLDANFYTAAITKFANIQTNYSGLLDQAQASARAETPSLYRVTTEVMGEKLLERRDFLFIALALALGGMVAVISALLWPAKQREDA